MKAKVWVVEMWNRDRQRWEPCSDCRLTKRDAEYDRRTDWMERNPDDRFRVAKYDRKEQG